MAMLHCEICGTPEHDVKALRHHQAYVCGRNWQPIETAPKDGTSFLCWNNNRIVIVRWLDSKSHFVREDDWLIFENPTHWIPLPEPPQ